MSGQETKSDLKGKVDLYGGILIDESSLPEDSELFSIVLQASIDVWKSEERRGLWLKLPIPSHAGLLPEALKNDFTLHHCTESYLMLTRWLPSTPNTLPLYTSHFVGVGGFVVNDKRQILVIQEKNGPAVGRWKVPGGMVDPKEDIPDAAVREVLEETGIPCQFQSIVSFRQHHRAQFGKSDLYFICFLKPEHCNITIQESEIAAAKWMDLDEFVEMPYLKGGVYGRLLDAGRDFADGKYTGIIAESLPVIFREGNNLVYSTYDSKL